MYCRSLSKPVSGDACAVTDAAGDGDGAVLEVLGERLHPERIKMIISPIGPIGPILFRWRQTLINVLIPNIHDRALRILIDNIKPTTQPRLVEEVVMVVI